MNCGRSAPCFDIQFIPVYTSTHNNNNKNRMKINMYMAGWPLCVPLKITERADLSFVRYHSGVSTTMRVCCSFTLAVSSGSGSVCCVCVFDRHFHSPKMPKNGERGHKLTRCNSSNPWYWYMDERIDSTLSGVSFVVLCSLFFLLLLLSLVRREQCFFAPWVGRVTNVRLRFTMQTWNVIRVFVVYISIGIVYAIQNTILKYKHWMSRMRTEW